MAATQWRTLFNKIIYALLRCGDLMGPPRLVLSHHPQTAPQYIAHRRAAQHRLAAK
jgi:hypothetical protein